MMDEAINDTIKAAALEAQRRHIFRLMLAHYVGDRRMIDTWSDFRCSLAFFQAAAVNCGLTYGRIRRRLDRMAMAGDLERCQPRKGGPIGYRFPRIICDEMADEAIRHYQSIGYSQSYIRQKVEPT